MNLEATNRTSKGRGDGHRWETSGGGVSAKSELEPGALSSGRLFGLDLAGERVQTGTRGCSAAFVEGAASRGPASFLRGTNMPLCPFQQSGRSGRGGLPGGGERFQNVGVGWGVAF